MIPISVRGLIKRLALLTGATTIVVCNRQHDICCTTHSPWVDDWDNRQDMYEENCELFERNNFPKLTITRNILLIRSGHYLDKDKESLTSLGIEQAEILAKRLYSLNFRFKTIYYADNLERCRETAEIISRCLQIETEPCSLLRNGDPIQPIPDQNWQIKSPQQLQKDNERIEAAFREYFCRPDATKQNYDTCEILVCPSNLIRFFVCRALQFPPEAWCRFSLFNCSVTWIQIRDDGIVQLFNVGSIGHFPQEKITA